MELTLPFEASFKRMPFARYCVAAGVLAFTCSALLLAAAWLTATALGFRVALPAEGGPAITWIDIFGIALFAPLIETLLLIGLLKLLGLMGLRDRAACGVSATLWALGHGLLHPMRFFGSILSFIIFGAGYLYWRRQSAAHGFMAAAVPHMIVNSTAAVLLLASGA